MDQFECDRVWTSNEKRDDGYAVNRDGWRHWYQTRISKFYNILI